MSKLPLYLDRTLTHEQRAAALLKEMSIAEKMSQLNCFMPRDGNPEELAQKHPLGVGHISTLQIRAVDTLDEAAQFTRNMQETVMRLSPHQVPAILHMEGLCGAYIPGAASFPSGIGRASGWNPVLEEVIGRIVARQERSIGITHTFAPVLDISRDSRMGRQGETYGEDPTLAAALGSAFTHGVQTRDDGVLSSDAVAKHFLGFHHSEAGMHGTHCDLPARPLREIYAKPFQAAISEAGLMGVMPCYDSLDGEPVSASEALLTGLLRDEMGFDGVTVADYCAIMNIHSVHKLEDSFTAAGLRALSAGLDAELHFVQCYNDELVTWFADGRADMAVLDQAVLRVLTAKFRMGLFENPFGLAHDKLRTEFNQPEDKAVSKQSALESIILLKNDGVLPIRRDVQKIAVIGYHAATARAFFGGYSHFSMREGLYAEISTMAGVKETGEIIRNRRATYPGSQVEIEPAACEELLKILAPESKSLLDALRARLPHAEIIYAPGYPFTGDDLSGHEAALKAAAAADLVILTLGGKYGTSSIASTGEGLDSTSIGLPICQERFIERLSELGKPAVGIHFDGRPISSKAADCCLGAILEAWSPAEAGAEAIVEILAGDSSPSGKLPVTVAFNAGQIPIYYNHPNGSGEHQSESIGLQDYVDCPHRPRYCFGHGLSYARFTYSDLMINAQEVDPDGELTISLKVHNDGDYAGDEIVQLYVSDRFASMTRPVVELAGFRRITLQPGESRSLRFSLAMSQLAFLDRMMRWKVEAGDIDVYIGRSVEDIRLTGSFRIAGDRFIEGRHRRFYAHSELQ